MAEEHSQIVYRWLPFTQLTTFELYQLLRLRQQIFVVEQNCPYLDADGLDGEAWHLLGSQYQGEKEQLELVACLRVIAPGKKFIGPTIGRLATASAFRGQGIGRELMQKALHHAITQFPCGHPITISAQLYLKKFYEQLGFVTVSEPYDEDAILHIDMIYRN